MKLTNDQKRAEAARGARARKEGTRPKFGGGKTATLGLLPGEIERFYAGVDRAKGRHHREFVAHMKRMQEYER